MKTNLLDRPTPTPDIVDDLTRRELVVGGLSLGLLGAAGCSPDGPGGGSEPGPDGLPVAIDHLEGRATLDGLPERVVAMEGRLTAETAALLGLPMIAIAVGPEGLEKPLRTLPGFVDLAQELTGPDGANYEQLLLLRPDLILSTRNGWEVDHEKLSEIAPTVFLENTREKPWPEITRALARAVGRVEQAETAIAEYERRRDELAARYADHLTVGVRVFYAGAEDGVFVYGRLGLLVQTLLDLGGRVPDDYPEEGQDLSLEQIGELDADLLIRLSFGQGDADLTENQIFQKLPAVQAGNFVTVDGLTANIGGLYSALECLHNLEIAYAAYRPA